MLTPMMFTDIMKRFSGMRVSTWKVGLLVKCDVSRKKSAAGIRKKLVALCVTRIIGYGKYRNWRLEASGSPTRFLLPSGFRFHAARGVGLVRRMHSTGKLTVRHGRSWAMNRRHYP